MQVPAVMKNTNEFCLAKTPDWQKEHVNPFDRASIVMQNQISSCNVKV